MIADFISPAKCVLSLLPVCQQMLVEPNGRGLAGHYRRPCWVCVALMYATALVDYLLLEKLITVTLHMKNTVH